MTRKTRLKFKPLTERDLTFRISKEPDSAFEIDGSFSDPESAKLVKLEIANGNEWAWCVVCVSAEWNGFQAADYLGACSYADERGFKEGGYFEDMKETVLNSINAQIAASLERISGRVRCTLPHAK